MKDTAPRIAETEPLRHYPDHKREGDDLVLRSNEQHVHSPDIWSVEYDVPGVLDSRVIIQVNAQSGAVVSYQDSWA
jgi:hypothetical protein